ncbi:MAG: hypothetical protein GY906_23940 [bacterium]|nr:hypothetical protein [bacterium]
MTLGEEVVMAQVGAEAADECIRASKIHAPFNSSHEAYAVISEELDEFWEQVRLRRQSRSPERMRKELIQVAAMAIRAVCDLKLQPGRLPVPTQPITPYM